MTYTPAHNLAHILSMFHDTPEYDRVSIRRGKDGSLDVRFLSDKGKMLAKFDCRFLLPDFPIVLTYHNIDDTRMEGLYGLGYPGMRSSFMLTAGDEVETSKYWARRKKPKKAKATFKGMLGRMSKEVIAEQLKAGKSLLATLTE